ncbi:chaperone protein HscA [Volucribacter psittacicida]|uniref:Ancillary SecYEG translocon subunit n=1 Tax=Volucribacter psittacicida TaxID=203482 RepID=A0A4R1G4P7_9PAST|nr:tetratricopeptide repeat protein [Volucribacter psittacicida]TCK01453.1 chaperone protein HscA [Volucribacter psittacicida]
MAYSAEEEQDLEQLKSWWQQNYLVIIIAVIIAFVAVFGWRYWQSYQQEKMLQASHQYEQLLYQNKDNSAQIAELIQQHGNSSYAVFALLDQAKNAVEKQQFAEAENALKQATQQAKDDILLSISAIRLAAVQYQQQQFDQALESLKLVKGDVWQSRKDLLTGDILLAKGDKAGAKASYQQAQNQANPFEQQWIEVRLNNL